MDPLVRMELYESIKTLRNVLSYPENPKYIFELKYIIVTHGKLFFLSQVLLLLLGTIGCTIACSITIVIPVAMIVIGSG